MYRRVLLLIAVFCLATLGLGMPAANAAAAGAGAGAGAGTLPPGDLASYNLNLPGSPLGLVAGSDGNLWIADAGGFRIEVISPAGKLVANYPVSGSPLSLIRGPGGNLWFVAQNYAASVSFIGSITPSGTVTLLPLPSSDGMLTSGLAEGSDGNLWFTVQASGAGNGFVGNMTPDGVVTQYPLPVEFQGGNFDITAGSDGNLWFIGTTGGDSLQSAIGMVTTSGAITMYPLPHGDAVPSAITAGPDGNLWFLENFSTFGTSIAGRISPLGSVTCFPLLGNNLHPGDITVGPDGNLYFTEGLSPGANDIGNLVGMTTDGTMAVYQEFQYGDPIGVAAGADGNVWFTDPTYGIGKLTINEPYAATINVTTTANPAIFDQAGSMTATLTPDDPTAPTPTGTATFVVNGLPFATVPVVNGTATIPLATLPPPEATTAVTYNGDTNYGPVTSNLLYQAVNAAETTTTLTSSSNPSTPGQSVTFTANVAPNAPGGGTPNGSVTFVIDGATRSAQLQNAIATVNVSNLTAGTHSISASYVPTNYGFSSADYKPSNASLTQTVGAAATSTTLAVSPSSGVLQGSPVTLTANVAPQAAGTVQFYDGGTALGAPVTVAGGTASYTSSALGIGSHTLTAVFTPTDSGFSASTSSAVSLTVSLGVTFAVTSNSNIPRRLTTSDLRALYHCDPNYVGTAPTYSLHPLLPQAGSALRTAWESTVGITDTDVNNGLYPCISSTLGGQPATDNNTVALDANSLVPVSIAAYLAQSQGISPDTRGKAILGTINSVAPVVAGPSQTVTFAVTSNSNIPRRLTTTDLRALYHCDPNYVGTAPYSLHPLLPQSGSALRTAWESIVGITDADVNNGLYPCISSTLGGQPATDNNTVALDANSVVPVSIGAYLAQSQGTSPDTRGQAVLGTIDSAPPAVPASGSSGMIYAAS